jgi:hypothetical protein
MSDNVIIVFYNNSKDKFLLKQIVINKFLVVVNLTTLTRQTGKTPPSLRQTI